MKWFAGCQATFEMCWSWEVSLAFSIAHWIGITYLLIRKQTLDRWYAMALVPLAVQETMQFVGWILIDKQHATAYTCDTSLKVCWRMRTCPVIR